MNTTLPGTDTPKNSSELIAKNILILEGKDEELLIEKMLKHLDITGIQCIDIQGKPEFEPTIRSLPVRPGVKNVQKIGFVADADVEKAESTFNSFTYHLEKAGFVAPTQLVSLSSGSPQIAIFVMPNNHDAGMLEDLCLQSISEDSLRCINDFMRCTGMSSETVKYQKRQALAYLSIATPFTYQVGLAAQQKVWNFDHPCFDQLKTFLEQFH